MAVTWIQEEESASCVIEAIDEGMPKMVIFSIYIFSVLVLCGTVMSVIKIP